jgi:hypothetical protein
MLSSIPTATAPTPRSRRQLIEWTGFDMTLDELLSWIEDNRYVRTISCEERDRYNLELADCS